jgi:DNA-binding response OmpR family regulator
VVEENAPFAGEVSRMGPVTILAVSPAEEDHLLLSHVFTHSNWKCEMARTCAEALEVLRQSEVAVVICAAELPDGTWKDLLAKLVQPVPPRLIVASRLADDHLWAEVLDFGGYDVLGMPFEPPEVIRVVSLAWRQWQHESRSAARR